MAATGWVVNTHGTSYVFKGGDIKADEEAARKLAEKLGGGTIACPLGGAEAYKEDLALLVLGGSKTSISEVPEDATSDVHPYQ